MIFLNPLLLLALPLIAGPLLIHLINQRRHQSVEWGAMRFLLSAKRMSKGMARFRHIMIMTARVLVVAGLIIAVSRPLATGWFGNLTGGKAETLIVLLDRSASMQQQNLKTGESKMSSALNKIVDMVNAYGGAKRIVLIDSATNTPTEVDTAESLMSLIKTRPTDSFSDIPEVLQSAADYISENQSGQTDVWLCSDANRGDWRAQSDRWDSLRTAFSERKGVRFSVLNFSQPPKNNYSIKVTSTRRIHSSSQDELVFDLEIRRSEDLVGETEIPIEVVINGARSVIQARMNNSVLNLKGNSVAMEDGASKGWGKVSLPADSSGSDNVYYFSYADQVVWKTVLVAEDHLAVQPLKMICSVGTDSNQKLEASVVDPDAVSQIDWESTAMIVWQAKLPTGTIAKQLQGFIQSGRSVVFFPPEQASQNDFSGASWGDWKRSNTNRELEHQRVGYWRNDDEVLRRTQAGDALPVDALKVFQYCSLAGKNHRPLASLDDGSPLLVRQQSNHGSVYFCSTLPTLSYSNLAKNGVVIFAMLHRILSESTHSIGSAKQFEAGSVMANVTKKMKVVAGEKSEVFSEEQPFLAGVYSDDKSLIAINRPPEEDTFDVLAREEIETLFEGLSFQIIDDQLGNSQPLASEVWRAFMVLMGIALLAEAFLCLPPKEETVESNAASSWIQGFEGKAS